MNDTIQEKRQIKQTEVIEERKIGPDKNGVMMYSSEGITVLGGREEKWENVYQQLIPS